MGCVRQGASWQPSVVGLLQAVFVPSSSSRSNWLVVGRVISLSAGPWRGTWVPGLPAQACRAGGRLFCRGHGSWRCPGAAAARPRARGGRGLRVEDPPSTRQESWAWPRKSLLPFLLVLGTRPCRASSVAIPSYTRVQMAFSGLAGPALAGSQHCRPRLGCSEPLWHFRSPTGHPLGRRSVPTGERWLPLTAPPQPGTAPR